MNVYHRVPAAFTGRVLYPLNQLKDSLPAIYAREVGKYRGRTQLLQRVIPYLDCLWNDVLHFTTVHPMQIRDALTEVGFNWTPAQWFEIDPDMIEINASNAVIYTHPVRAKGDFSTTEDDFVPFSQEVLAMLNSIPRETIEYFNEAKAHDERPFLFNFMPHVLYLGTLDTDQIGVSVIKV